MKRRALISGITGQDGSLLAEFLLGNPNGIEYEVHGIYRRASTVQSTRRVDHLYHDPHLPGTRLFLHHGNLTDSGRIRRIVAEVRPDEVYHLGAQSHVAVSFGCPEETVEVGVMGTLAMLEAVRHEAPQAAFYNAGSSEQFGSAPPPQNERTPFQPRSPYGCAKVASFFLTRNYREAYGLRACSGILFNHESPGRGETFVTRKVTLGAARIKYGLQRKLWLGNLDARRDWGWAPDFVRGMWLMLQRAEPEDLVLATGEDHSVGDLVREAFRAAGLDWTLHVDLDRRYLRPAEVDHLRGDSARAREVLGWEPTKRFPEIVRAMVEADVLVARRELAVKREEESWARS